MQAPSIALRFLLQSGKAEQGCSKLLANAALFSGRAAVAAESKEGASAIGMTVAQYSSAEAAALAAKKQNLIGLGGLSLKPFRPMKMEISKGFATSAAAATAVEAAAPAKEATSMWSKMAKAAAALLAAVALVLSPPALADAPMPWQWGFQDSASSTAQAVMDLHHDIMFFLITITVLVLYLVFQFATKFHYSHVGPIAEKLTHHTTLEVIWTVIPTLIVLAIGIPSLTLIYSMDQQNEKPGLTVKVIGRQWYWSYEMHDHLQHKLIDPDRLVAIAEKSLKA